MCRFTKFFLRTMCMLALVNLVFLVNGELFLQNTAKAAVQSNFQADMIDGGGGGSGACSHSYSAATCTKPKTCTKCGTTTGSKLGHNYQFTSCVTPDKCTRCGQTTGTPSGHPGFTAATCTSPARCIRCGEENGNKLAHAFECKKIDGTWHAERCKNCSYSKSMERHIMNNNKCTQCDYEFICNHTYADATCTSPKKCTKCGTTTGSKLGHNYQFTSCVTPDKCTRCGQTTGTPSGHPGFTAATCTSPARCIRCGEENGNKLAHAFECKKIDGTWHAEHCKNCSYSKSMERHVMDNNKCTQCDYEFICNHTYADATCTKPKTCTKCGATSGDVLAHNYSIRVGKFYNEKQHYEKYKCSCGEVTYINYQNHIFSEEGKCINGCSYAKKVDTTECNHTYKWEIVKNATCKADGKKENKCTKCGKIEKIETLKALGHDYAAATCTEAKKCKRCNATEGKALGHNFNTKVEVKYDNNRHWEIWKCSCGESEKRNQKEHELIDNKCACGYTFVCKHDGKTKTENIYKNNELHIVKITCEKCNELIKEESKNHNSNVIEMRAISHTVHTKTLQCKICNAKYYIEENHDFKNNLCECGMTKDNEEIKLEKIVFENEKNSSKNTYTIKVGESINLLDKVKLTPNNAKVNLKFRMTSGENGAIVLETYSGKLEAKKVSTETIKVKVTDVISGLSDEVIIKVIKNPEIKDEEDVEIPKFEDIEDDSWYKEEVEDAVEDGLFNGTSENTFSPNNPITRGMFVTVLARMDKADIENFANVFDDVKEDAYYQESISWAVANGIVKGVGEGKFSPDAQITREATAVIIYNYIKMSHKGLLEEVAETEDFADQSEISDWAEEAVMALKSIGLVNGKSEGNYKPKDTVTRAEGAVILQRLSEKIKTDEIVKEEERCSGEKVREDHKQNIKTEYEIVTNDTHRIKYNCVECKNNWVDKPVAHTFKDGKCICGHECLHAGSKITDERYNNDGQLVKVTICENCKFITNEEIVKVNTGNYSPSDFSQYKPVMDKNSYTDADWDRMEAELKARVEQAGYGTRAGVVEAALYLASLDYAMPYRGTPMQREIYIGAYNKIGMNRTWGHYVKTTREISGRPKGYNAINGMDCGAFVTWAFINGGVIDTDESISYKTSSLTQDKGSLSDRMKRELEYSNLRAHPLKNVVDEVEPGDIIYTYGTRNGKKTWTHIGLIVGVDDENIYVAESNTTTYSPDTEKHSLTVNKLVVTRVPKTYTGNVLGYVVLCDDTIYKAKNPDGTENKGNMPQVWGN